MDSPIWYIYFRFFIGQRVNKQIQFAVGHTIQY